MSTTANTTGLSAATSSSNVNVASASRSRTASTAVHLQLEAAAERIATHYSPLNWERLPSLLNDRACVAYPCELRFDSEPLLPGEFGFVAPKGVRPEEGFVLYLHPHYAERRDMVPYLVVQQLAHVNSAGISSAEDAELFGSRALAIPQEEYYSILCRLAEEVGGDELC